MSSISSIEATKKIKEANLRLITPPILANLLNLSTGNTIYKIILRLEKYGLIQRIAKGKYTLSDLSISDFEKANLITTPSYISLESALNYHGILSQFPFSITSITVQKSDKINSLNKEFEYTHFSPKMFWGFEKKDNFLIATPEKALTDLIYLISKGLRKADIKELEYSNIDKQKFKDYAKLVTFLPFQKYIKDNLNIW